MRYALLLLIVAAGPASAAAESSYGCAAQAAESPLVSAWTQDLAELPSTRELSVFLRSNDVHFEFCDPSRAIFEESTGGEFDWKRNVIKLNSVLIGKIEKELSPQASTEDLAAIVAWKTLPIIAHETKHGVTGAAIAAAAGRRFDGPSIEDETLSFVAEAQASLDIVSKHPELERYKTPAIDGHNRTWPKLFKIGGVEDIELVVRRNYSGVPSILSQTSEEIASKARERAEQARKVGDDQKITKSVLEALAQTTSNSEVSARAADAVKDGFTDAAISHTEGLQDNARSVAEFVENPQAYARLKAYFQDQYDTLPKPKD